MAVDPRYAVPLPRVLVLMLMLCAQITAMASMKDSERLELLKEIGGTKAHPTC